jgi:ABC-type sugar transport system substrate-binding protein
MAAAAGAGAAAAAAAGQEEAMSSATKQKVAAAKQYIENHYKTQMKSLQERKERSVSALSVPVPHLPAPLAGSAGCELAALSWKCANIVCSIVELLDCCL